MLRPSCRPIAVLKGWPVAPVDSATGIMPFLETVPVLYGRSMLTGQVGSSSPNSVPRLVVSRTFHVVDCIQHDSKVKTNLTLGATGGMMASEGIMYG